MNEIFTISFEIVFIVTGRLALLQLQLEFFVISFHVIRPKVHNRLYIARLWMKNNSEVDYEDLIHRIKKTVRDEISWINVNLIKPIDDDSLYVVRWLHRSTKSSWRKNSKTQYTHSLPKRILQNWFFFNSKKNLSGKQW